MGYTIPVYVEHEWEADEYISLCIVNGNEEQKNRNVPTMIRRSDTLWGSWIFI